LIIDPDAHSLLHAPHASASGLFQPFATALTAPQLVSFDMLNFSVRPQLQFSFNVPNRQADIVYRLSAVLYFGGGGHFTPLTRQALGQMMDSCAMV